MSTLTMPSAHHRHAGYHGGLSWQDLRSSEALYESYYDPARVALPSIRQAIPELEIRIRQDDPMDISSAASATINQYLHSPIKRRRLSCEEDVGLGRSRQFPRLYTNATQLGSEHHHHYHHRSLSASRPMRESWLQSSGTGSAQSVQSPTLMDLDGRIESRQPSLPSLPQVFEQSPAQIPQMRSLSRTSFIQDSMRSGSVVAEDPRSTYRRASYGFPFSSSYDPAYGESLIRIGELGMGMNNDHKQRKRRGNLPKETTDKLRSWFVAHLHHPYPTEDEKQELMRQTGLQMNQISNWFINARRRQLPLLTKNALAESERMSRGNGNGKVLPSTERDDYADLKQPSLPLSDDDVELDAGSRAIRIKRGSI